MADARKSPRRPCRLRRAALLAALVVVVAAGSAAYAVNSAGGPSYVTGTVTRGDVQQTLDLTGSVQQVNQVSAAFPVSGKVTSVNVTVGQHVSEGQELARIDAAPLQSALLEAQATLARAQATLQNDESGTSSTASTGTTSAAISGSIPTATLTAFTPTGSGRGATESSDLGSLEKAVTAAQAQAASSQAAVNSALLAAITACASSPSPSPSGTPTPSPSSSLTPTPSASASAHTTAYTSSGTSCANALAAVQRAETAEAAATRALGDAVNKLAAAAAAAARASGNSSANSGTGSGFGSGTGTSSSASSGSARSGSGPSGGQNSSGNGSSTNSASRIASDQAEVTTAQVAVADAQRNLDAAILRAPTDGTVASVGLSEGATASTSSAITIVSQGAARVTIDVPLASMPSVKVGQAAYVTPNGATTADQATVESIGLLPASSSTSTASYPVTVLVPDSDLMQLPTGSSAQVSLVMSTAHNAVTVPNSAVTRLGTGGSTAFVTVMKNGTATRTRVTTGAVGTLATQVISGLTVGQTIVLADRSASLPANSSTSTRVFGTGGGFAQFGGAGGFGGATRFSGRGG